MTQSSDDRHVSSSPKAPLPTLDDFGDVRLVPTRWEDNDHYGHINNVVYYSFFDTAVNLWLLESTGVDIRTLPEIGVVVSSGCQFLRSLSFPGRGCGRARRAPYRYIERDLPTRGVQVRRARGEGAGRIRARVRRCGRAHDRTDTCGYPLGAGGPAPRTILNLGVLPRCSVFTGI